METAQTAVERRGRGARRVKRRLLTGMRTAARPVGQAAALFLFSFVRWFGIPSPFATAFLLAGAH